MHHRVLIALGAALLAAGAPGAGAQELRGREAARAESHLVKPADERVTPELVSRLRVPPGFRVAVHATGLGSPRTLAVGADGALYVADDEHGVSYRASHGAAAPRRAGGRAR